MPICKWVIQRRSANVKMNINNRLNKTNTKLQQSLAKHSKATSKNYTGSVVISIPIWELPLLFIIKH